MITGYTDNGKRFLCRTYFDQETFDALEEADRRMVFEGRAPFGKKEL